jgi:hypothetical protein
MEKNTFLMFLLLCIVLVLFLLYKNKNEMLSHQDWLNTHCSLWCANDGTWQNGPSSECLQECIDSGTGYPG